MITMDGTLKVSDFGVAERMSSFEDSSYCSKTQGKFLLLSIGTARLTL